MSSCEPIPPAEYILDEIEARSWSRDTLADKLNTTRADVDRLLDGRVKIDADLAIRLGRAFGTDDRLWINLQASYDTAVEKLRERLLLNLTRLRVSVSQIIRDVQSWNDNRHDEQPFDCESERLALDKIDRCIECVTNREPMPGKLYGEIVQHLREAVEQI